MNDKLNLNNEFLDALVVECLLPQLGGSTDLPRNAAWETADPIQKGGSSMNADDVSISEDLVDALVAASLRVPSISQTVVPDSAGDVSCGVLSASERVALDSVCAGLADEIVSNIAQATQLDHTEESAWCCIYGSTSRGCSKDEIWEMVDRLVSLFQAPLSREQLTHVVGPLVDQLCASQPPSLVVERRRAELVSAIGRVVIACCRSQAEAIRR